MNESLFRTPDEIEARRLLHEAIGRFIVAYGLVFGELLSACRLMLERSGMTKQPLANIVFANARDADMIELVKAMYKEFRPTDVEGAKRLDVMLNSIHELREQRNGLVHAAWTLGIPDDQGNIEHIAHSVKFGRNASGQTFKERIISSTEVDELSEKAIEFQVYAIRLCQSINQTDLPLAEQLSKPVSANAK